ncbi:carbonic anhydrase, partial [Tremellales sp. Uapishka_1]
MATPLQQELVEGNGRYASNFEDGSLPLPPSKKQIIVTCMDSRIDVGRAFGVSLGSTHIIRNAGGSAKEALRSIIISQQLLGTEEILIIKHTGCGMLTFNNEKGYDVVSKNLSESAGKRLRDEKFDFLTYKDTDEAVREEVEWLRKEEAVKKLGDDRVSGWVYDVTTGKVRKVL